MMLRFLLLLGAGALIGLQALILTVLHDGMLSHLVQVWQSFSMPLPWLSRWLVDYLPGWWLLPGLSLILLGLTLWRPGHVRAVLTLLTSAGASLVLMAAIYAPAMTAPAVL